MTRGKPTSTGRDEPVGPAQERKLLLHASRVTRDEIHIRRNAGSYSGGCDHHWSHGLATSVAVWLKSEHLKHAAKFKTKLPKHCWLR